MSQKTSSLSKSSDTLPPIDTNSRSNVTQVSTSPSFYIQDAKNLPAPLSTSVKHQKKSCDTKEPTKSPQPPVVTSPTPPLPPRPPTHSRILNEPSEPPLPLAPKPSQGILNEPSEPPLPLAPKPSQGILNEPSEPPLPYPPLSLKYMGDTQAIHDHPDQHAHDIAYVVKRLSSISVESHLTNPRKYREEFVFITRFLDGKLGETLAQSEEKWLKYYRAILQDGAWYKLIISLHSAASKKYKASDVKDSITNCALSNIARGLCSVVNATDRCKDPRLLQQTFDQLFEYMFNYLNNPEVVNFINEPSTPIGCIATSMVVTLHNLSYYHEPSIPIMRDRGMITVSQQIRKGSSNLRAALDSLLTIAYLVTEGEEKSMVRLTDNDLSYLLKELERSMLPISRSEYHPEELLDGLNRIAVSDINKLKLMECGILKLLEKSLNSETEYSVAHRTAAAKAVWNLAFSDDSRREIKENVVLVTALKSLKDSPEKELRSAVSGALWQLEGKEKHVQAIKRTQTSTGASEKHIMLSYNHQAKDEVFKMKDRLKQEGYKVWIDEEQITAGGSTLEAMSKAIEESCLVLIFFSEPYKNSVNCRAEAEYVFERRKPFLPVQVQAGYTPEGWLGILFGSKYRYTLSKPDKYNFEVAGLLAKIRELTTGPIQHAVTNDVPDAPITSAADKSVLSTIAQGPAMGAHQSLECESWSPHQISEWFDKHELKDVETSLGHMDGEVLAELATLSCSHKETFYTLMMSARSADVHVSRILKLGRVLHKLAFN